MLFAPPSRPDVYGPEWSARRREYQSRHPKVCYACGATSETAEIHLHHLRYNRRYRRSDYRRLTRVPDRWLMWLCEPEHQAVTSMHTGSDLSHLEATRLYLAANGVPFPDRAGRDLPVPFVVYRLYVVAVARARALAVKAARRVGAAAAIAGVLVAVAVFGDGWAVTPRLLGVVSGVGWYASAPKRSRRRGRSGRAAAAVLFGVAVLVAAARLL